ERANRAVRESIDGKLLRARHLDLEQDVVGLEQMLIGQGRGDKRADVVVASQGRHGQGIRAIAEIALREGERDGLLLEVVEHRGAEQVAGQLNRGLVMESVGPALKYELQRGIAS